MFSSCGKVLWEELVGVYVKSESNVGMCYCRQGKPAFKDSDDLRYASAAIHPSPPHAIRQASCPRTASLRSLSIATAVKSTKEV